MISTVLFCVCHSGLLSSCPYMFSSLAMPSILCFFFFLLTTNKMTYTNIGI